MTEEAVLEQALLVLLIWFCDDGTVVGEGFCKHPLERLVALDCLSWELHWGVVGEPVLRRRRTTEQPSPPT